MFKYILFIIAAIATTVAMANTQITKRIPQFSNDQVTVWETILYPNKSQVLTMHRHEHNRVLVSLDDGVLKITNDKGKVHFLKLAKDKSYWLTKDVANEMHTDENISEHPIKVLVIEVK
jgi:hypothetical protein